MQEVIKMIGCKEAYMMNYDSLGEFDKYINETPLSELFRWDNVDSIYGSRRFTGTESYEQAKGLFKSGWSEMAKDLTKKLKVIEDEVVPATRRKTIYDVAGFQCSVPRYLNGVPTSMIRTKNIPVKQKVVTLTKAINYDCKVRTETIIEESVKALQIVKKLEAQGARVNLNIIFATENANRIIGCKIKIKNANERLNVSKTAFPLVHPSMLRRLIFRFIEEYPRVTYGFKKGYGIPVLSEELKKLMDDNEYLIPTFVRSDLNNIDDLKKLK